MSIIQQFTDNNCLNNPGLCMYGGGTSSTLVAFSSFYFKANGRVAFLTSGFSSTLASATLVAPFPNGTATIAGALDYDDSSASKTGANACRVYTLVARVNPLSPYQVTTYWLAGADFPLTRPMQYSDIAHPSQSNDVEVGYVFLKNTASAWTPGTSSLASDFTGLTVQYIQNYGTDAS